MILSLTAMFTGCLFLNYLWAWIYPGSRKTSPKPMSFTYCRSTVSTSCFPCWGRTPGAARARALVPSLPSSNGISSVRSPRFQDVRFTRASAGCKNFWFLELLKGFWRGKAEGGKGQELCSSTTADPQSFTKRRWDRISPYYFTSYLIL